jgi:hypothetical protein
MHTRLLIISMVILSVVQGAAWGDDFILSGTDFLAVSSVYTQGSLHDSSSVDIQSGGSVDQLFAHDDSRVTLSAYSVDQPSAYSVDQLSAHDDSRVLISGGTVRKMSTDNTTEVHLSSGSVVSLFAGGSSTVNVSGGAVTGNLGGFGASQIEITGGTIVSLDAGGASLITFYGYGWSVNGSLIIEGDQVVGMDGTDGTGTLSGFWDDETPFSTEIYYYIGATIRLASGQDPCGECKGKVSQLTLRYTGPEATVSVEQKDKKAKNGRRGKKGQKGKKGGKGKKGEKRGKGQKGRGVSDGLVVFEGDLAEGELFTFVGHDDKGTLGTEISLFINGELNTTIHTSCSKPIYPGMKSGLFEVVEGHSLEGGILCPLDAEPPDQGCE